MFSFRENKVFFIEFKKAHQDRSVWINPGHIVSVEVFADGKMSNITTIDCNSCNVEGDAVVTIREAYEKG